MVEITTSAPKNIKTSFIHRRQLSAIAANAKGFSVKRLWLSPKSIHHHQPASSSSSSWVSVNNCSQHTVSRCVSCALVLDWAQEIHRCLQMQSPILARCCRLGDPVNRSSFYTAKNQRSWRQYTEVITKLYSCSVNETTDYLRLKAHSSSLNGGHSSWTQPWGREKVDGRSLPDAVFPIFTELYQQHCKSSIGQHRPRPFHALRINYSHQHA